MNEASKSFNLLDNQVQKWIWKQGWSTLKDIQENTIPYIIEENCDVIISASTAGGKTEAAFLPIISNLLKKQNTSGFQVLYISPLKALINDQYRRLLSMTENTKIQIIPWHGDIDASIKRTAIKCPTGILIITPESLESFFINKKQYVKDFFSNLRYVVIDELHSFIGTERGKQLQSLISRLELNIKKRIPHIAMSATFSDFDIVRQFLQNGDKFPCNIPNQGKNNHVTKVLIKSFFPRDEESVLDQISSEIFQHLRMSNNLVFTNNRTIAEEYTIKLSDICADNNVPNEFVVHHGNLSKSVREKVEHDLQQGEHPVTAICTSTMELGVDIGKVKSIAQIGRALSVSSLRQRLGRSGRRNEPSILRIFSTEEDYKSILLNLHSNLIQNIAVIELLREHKYEKPVIFKHHLSTLIQQILSVIAQFGSFYPRDGWNLLCKHGAFTNVSSSLFLKVLKSLGEKHVIAQLENGEIIIGLEGEHLLNKIDFYTAFSSPPEYRIINIANSKPLGVIDYCANEGELLILAGKRWLVRNSNKQLKTIYVENIKSGGNIHFFSNGLDIDLMITKKMKEIYLSKSIYPYLDTVSGTKSDLIEAREFFFHNHLDKQNFILDGKNIYFITWAGSKINRTIALIAKCFLKESFPYNEIGIANLTKDDIKEILKGTMPTPDGLANLIPEAKKQIEKYDYLLSEELLNIEYAKSYLDLNSALFLLKSLFANK